MRQSEHKYRELFECLDDAAFLTDKQSGRIIDTNRAAMNLLGCSRADILGRKESQFLNLSEAQPSEDKTQGSVDFETEIIRRDNKTDRVHVRTTSLMIYDRPLIFRLCHLVG